MVPYEQASRYFHTLLRWHLDKGTRPPGHRQGLCWTNRTFAKAITEAFKTTCDESAVRHWTTGRHLPGTRLDYIERVLFGDEPPQGQYATWRDDFRATYAEALRRRAMGSRNGRVDIPNEADEGLSPIAYDAIWPNDDISSGRDTPPNLDNCIRTHHIMELTKEEQQRIYRRPKMYIGRRYRVLVTKIGQAVGDDFIVDHDDGLAVAAGTESGDTIRFQIASGNHYIHRIHADGVLADRLLIQCSLQPGLHDAGTLTRKVFVIECRGKYKELTTGFVDFSGQREWAVIWRLVHIG